MTDNATPIAPQYAGFWKRLFAFFIDSLIVTTIVVVIALAIYGREYVRLANEGRTLVFDIVVQGILPAIAAILFWRFHGATPGKILLSMKIVDAKTLGPPSTGRLIGRYFAYIVSIVPIFLGFLWIAFDKRKQGWHDKLAGTVVIQVEED